MFRTKRHRPLSKHLLLNRLLSLPLRNQKHPSLFKIRKWLSHQKLIVSATIVEGTTDMMPLTDAMVVTDGYVDAAPCNGCGQCHELQGS